MTYEEYRVFADEDAPTGWVDGELTVFTSASGLPQGVGSIHALLLRFAGKRDAGTVRSATFEMVLLNLGQTREPDVLSVARANEGRLTPMRLLGPAELVIEVVFDESVTRASVDKRRDHLTEGIPEYQCFGPRPGQQRAAVQRLNIDGVYEEAALDASGSYHAAVLPGIRIDPAGCRRDRLPPLSDLMTKLVGG
jgi:hypothetical protein